MGQAGSREECRHKELINKNKESAVLHLEQIIVLWSGREPKNGVYGPVVSQQGALLSQTLTILASSPSQNGSYRGINLQVVGDQQEGNILPK